MKSIFLTLIFTATNLFCETLIIYDEYEDEIYIVDELGEQLERAEQDFFDSQFFS